MSWRVGVDALQSSEGGMRLEVIDEMGWPFPLQSCERGAGTTKGRGSGFHQNVMMGGVLEGGEGRHSNLL